MNWSYLVTKGVDLEAKRYCTVFLDEFQVGAIYDERLGSKGTR